MGEQKKKIELMHELFGTTPGAKCAACQHMIVHEYSGKLHRKCGVYGDSRSESSEWRQKYPACGLYNTPTKIHSVMLMVKVGRKKTPKKPLPGQMELF